MAKGKNAKYNRCKQFLKELDTATTIEQKLLKLSENNILHHIIANLHLDITKQELDYLLKDVLGCTTNKKGC